MSGPGPSPDGRGDAPHGADSDHPRLRPLDRAALAEALGEPSLRDGGERWSDLLAELQADPPRTTLLLRTLGWGLGLRELLWWGCLSAKLEEIVSGRRPPSRALLAAERWLREGEDEVRYEAYRAARDEGRASPAVLMGYAAFAAGPSLAPADAPPEPAPPGTPRGAAGGVLLAAATAPALEATGSGFELVNMIGLDIARGGDGRAAARRALAVAAPEATAPA